MAVDQLLYVYVLNEEDYPANSVIVKEGSKGDWMYVILEGKVKVKKNTPKGMVTIGTLNEGDIIGEMALFDPVVADRTRTASAIADGGPVKMGVLDTNRLLKDFESISPQLKGLTRTLVKRLSDTTQRAVNLAMK
ncbi:MAG: cyclic nucleotide-binding domain-containing protein [Desulfobacterales bacterium]|nr:cyclic nucleotide-binding domain-containing protein [Desulfobacterales bacterium]